MQTFLPFKDFEKSAEALDNKRLFKQIVECKQILKAIADPSYGWQHHPAVLMWKGYYGYLRKYQREMLQEWIERRWNDGIHPNQHLFLDRESLYYSQEPPWLGDERVHSSHRAMLYRKDPEHYKQFKADAEEWLEPKYYWPVTKENIKEFEVKE